MLCKWAEQTYLKFATEDYIRPTEERVILSVDIGIWANMFILADIALPYAFSSSKPQRYTNNLRV